jgi:hypothetical protein
MLTLRDNKMNGSQSISNDKFTQHSSLSLLALPESVGAVHFNANIAEVFFNS